MDLIKNVGFTIQKGVQKNVLTQRQIDLVNEARKKIKGEPAQFLDWDDARKTLNSVVLQSASNDRLQK